MVAAAPKKPFINNKALAWTIGVHALLLLLFVLLQYTVPAPILVPVDDGSGGMEVNLGTTDDGSGTDQPMMKKKPAPYEATVVFKNTPTPPIPIPVPEENSLPPDIVKSDVGDAPAIDNTRKKAERTTEREKPKKQEPPKYTYKGETGAGGNSASVDKKGNSEGNTTGTGDRGVPGGTPGAPNYTGTPGSGTGGIGHSLGGRNISPDKFEAEFSESGKVVIRVTVDRNGKIVDKRVKSSSSTQLTRIAMEKIKDVSFSKSTGAEPQQFGDITIIFKTRQ